MVSPVDKNGGDIAPFFGVGNDPRASYNQAGVDGAKMTYSSGTPFGDVLSGRNSNQYMASRGAGGWSTHAIDAPVGGVLEEVNLNLTYVLETAFKLFTPDLSRAWIQDASTTPLAPDAALGVPNLYRRDNLSGSYEALTNEEPAIPQGQYALEYQLPVRGHSSDYSDILFEARAQMTPNAAPNKFEAAEFQTYDAADGQLRLVSVLPNGDAYSETSVGGALSGDGSRAYWLARRGGAGSVYLRENPGQAQSALAHGGAFGSGELTGGSNEVTGVTTSTGAFAVGQDIVTFEPNGVERLPLGTTITAVGPGSLTLSAAPTESVQASLLASSGCTEPDKACTIPVSESVTEGQQGNFELANADGSKAVFSIGDSVLARDLYLFDADTRTPTLIANKSWGAVGISEDGSRVYFVTDEDLGGGAVAGERNLYLDEEGSKTFIASLSPLDVSRTNPFELVTTITGEGRYRGSRVSPDGRHLVFMSRSKALSEATAGYDNTDAVSGSEDREVYVYEAGGELQCVSCNPSGARPTGQLLEASFVEPGHGMTDTWAAAWIPGWEHELLAQRVLSDDGSRVFFNSYDALLPSDTNGVQDVYQWRRPGSGECTEASSSYSARNGGCVDLISSGQSPQLSEFVDATPNGSDVFFTTGSSLIKPDPGLIDIYDARVGGGFDYPTTTPGCEGETCQGTPAPPNDATPASAAYNGPGNVKEPAKKKKQKKKSKKQKNKKQKKSKKKGGKAKRHAAGNSTRANG